MVANSAWAWTCLHFVFLLSAKVNTWQQVDPPSKEPYQMSANY